jgi:hypothetical protein
VIGPCRRPRVISAGGAGLRWASSNSGFKPPTGVGGNSTIVHSLPAAIPTGKGRPALPYVTVFTGAEIYHCRPRRAGTTDPARGSAHKIAPAQHRYNAAPTQDLGVVLRGAELGPFPFWAKDAKIG